MSGAVVRVAWFAAAISPTIRVVVKQVLQCRLTALLHPRNPLRRVLLLFALRKGRRCAGFTGVVHGSRITILKGRAFLLRKCLDFPQLSRTQGKLCSWASLSAPQAASRPSTRAQCLRFWRGEVLGDACTHSFWRNPRLRKSCAHKVSFYGYQT